MRVVVAPDKFKGSLSAPEAAPEAPRQFPNPDMTDAEILERLER